MVGRTRIAMSVLAAFLAVAVGTADAAEGNAERGETIYAKRCVLCHGADGDADSPASDVHNPPPRDFTEGQYKYKTTAFSDAVPNDDDLFRMIRDGMPGTGMPGWSDMLSEGDMWDLVAHIKTFAGLEEEKPETQLDYGTPIESSPESIAAGLKLFGDRCVECHGEAGRGDGIKKLKDDLGSRTWPRNLTKPWTYRASNTAQDVYARISIGIPGTQMPSFADPKSKKKLTVEERWHVANYVTSLVDDARVVRPENIVVKADRVEGAVPSAPDDPRWAESEPTTFFVLPQIIAKERFFTPANDTVTVRAFYGDSEVALLLEWDDRTKSIPGDTDAAALAEGELGQDVIAVQLPITVPAGMEKPYFVMGDAESPVNVWRWRSGTTDEPAGVALLTARGADEIEERDAAGVGIAARGAYENGTWRVVIKRPLKTEDADDDIQFEEGRFIPIAFAAWDGSNGEAGSKHTITTWYWLLLKPPTGFGPILAAVIVIVVLGAAELWWARSAATKRAA